MDNIQKKHHHSFEEIARRTAFPFFLFAVVLAGLLTVSWYVVVPRLTHVEVSGTVRGLQELKGYKADLEAQIIGMENERGSFLAPVDNDLYHRLKTMKESRLSFQRLRAELGHIVKNLVPDQNNVVKLESFTFDAQSSTAELRGEIRNVGPRSMTVLARFVEQVHALSMVIDVEATQYIRQESDDYGFFSPFVLHLKMQ